MTAPAASAQCAGACGVPACGVLVGVLGRCSGSYLHQDRGAAARQAAEQPEGGAPHAALIARDALSALPPSLEPGSQGGGLSTHSRLFAAYSSVGSLFLRLLYTRHHLCMEALSAALLSGLLGPWMACRRAAAVGGAGGGDGGGPANGHRVGTRALGC